MENPVKKLGLKNSTKKHSRRNVVTYNYLYSPSRLSRPNMVHDVTTKYQMAREIIVMPKVGPEEKQAGEWLQFFIPRVVMQTHTQTHSYSHYASFSMLLLLLPIIDFFQLFCFFFALDIFISSLTLVSGNE